MGGNATPNWFAEPPIRGFQQRMVSKAILCQTSSSFQLIEVHDTVPFGRTLVLEGAVQTTIRDEFHYHEMLVHPALLGHPSPVKVLIIGGGDGGVLRRVLEHAVDRALLVEIDRQVVDVCARFMPEIAAGALQDSRSELLVADGIRFVEQTDEQFDVVIVDSTDPVGPAAGLFGVDFYRSVGRTLRTGGLLVTQSGSPLLMQHELGLAASNLSAVFPFVRCYLGIVPSYPGSLWSFLLAAKTALDNPLFDPAADGRARAIVAERFASLRLKTNYYSPDIHFASFALPQFVRDALVPGAAA